MNGDPAFLYDYDNDERWQGHLANLSLRSSDGGQDDALLTLAKQNWYQRYVDPTYQPTFDTVDFVEQKTLNERKHEWKSASFAKPTFCEVCNLLLWGVRKQGLKCRGCRAVCHSKCRAEADKGIICKFAAPAAIYSNTHELYETHFSTPAYCNVCRKMLRGFVRQGLACSKCAVVCHDDCQAKMLVTCKRTHMELLPEPSRSLQCRWVEGNIRKATSTLCVECGKDTGSVKALTGYQCQWCRSCLHTNCRTSAQDSRICDYGLFSDLILQPTWVGHSPDTKCRDDDPHGACIVDLVVDIPDQALPLIVFINKRSGGQEGDRVIRRMAVYLNPLQIFDLAEGGPAPALRAFQKAKNFRILVCGGDGTIGWVLTLLDVMKLSCKPPTAVLPLGTGNDLARTLGWGGGYNGESMHAILKELISAHTVMVDRWQLLRKVKNTAAESADDSELAKSTAHSTAGDGYQVVSILNNYFSVGIDAKVALSFHNAREANPQKFTSRSSNKMFYAKAGMKEMFSGCRNLRKNVKLICDGKEIQLPDVQAIVVTNLPSYSGGVNLWNIKGSPVTIAELEVAATVASQYLVNEKSFEGETPAPSKDNESLHCQSEILQDTENPDDQSTVRDNDDHLEPDNSALEDENQAKNQDETRQWSPQSIRDGLLEVVGLRSSLQVGMIYVNMASAVRLCQGKQITISIAEGVELPVQADGEPWLQSSCDLRIEFFNQVPMLASDTCKW